MPEYLNTIRSLFQPSILIFGSFTINITGMNIANNVPKQGVNVSTNPNAIFLIVIGVNGFAKSFFMPFGPSKK